jgi:hypothetical protein
MNTQARTAPSAAALWHLAAGQPAFGVRGPGELAVLEGRVWLTREGDMVDHVLARGERIQIDWADRVVVESWERDRAATLQWRPVERRRPSQLRAGGLRGLAALAAGAALAFARAGAGFDALARSAASSARRAQGCINCGDSMASSGAAK